MKKTLFSFLVGFCVCTPSYGSVDGTSVLTDDTLGIPVEREGRVGWAHEPRFPRELDLREFLYIAPPPPHGIKGEENLNPVLYNTYPFDLPSAVVETGTLHLSQERPFVGAEGILLPRLHQAFRTGVNQIMITNSPDIRPLGLLGTAFGGEEGRESYGFHFFGRARADLLDELRIVLEAWKGGLAVCKHLDFAFIWDEDGIDFRDAAQRQGFLGSLVPILNGFDIETLSLRFMHLTDADLRGFVRGLVASSHPSLKRLVFSFNDITDAAMTEGGSIGDLLMAEMTLPLLQVLDLRGNYFRNPATWTLALPIEIRTDHLRSLSLLPWLGLSNHGFSGETLARIDVRRVLDPLRRYSALEQPEGYTTEDSVALKQIYSGIPQDNFLSHWVLKNAPYHGDLLLLLKHGKNPRFRSLDLRGRTMEAKQVLAFLSHASRHPLEVIDLRESYGGRGYDRYHKAIVDTLRTFPETKRLSLSRNPLGSMAFYGEVIRFLTNLRSLTFSLTGFGSGDPELFLDTVQDHFTLRGFRENLSLRFLDYSRNVITDRDMQSIFTKMSRSRGIYWVSLADNQIRLERGIGETGYGSEVLKFLSEVPPLKYLDLRGNPISVATVNALIEAYRGIDGPVLAIDGLREDGTRTPVQYVSSASGFLRLGRFYDAKNAIYDSFIFEEEPNPMLFYDHAVRRKMEDRTNIIYKILQADPSVEPLNISALPLGDTDDEIRARAHLKTYRIELTEPNIENRSKLLKFLRDSRAMLMDSTINCKSLFKSLPEKEQKYRIIIQLAILAATRPRGVDVVTDDQLSDIVVMDRALESLI